MAERDQRRGLLRGHDAGQPRRLQRIALLHGAARGSARSASRDIVIDAARDRLARGHRLVADVDHLDAPARVDVRQRGLALDRPTCPAAYLP